MNTWTSPLDVSCDQCGARPAEGCRGSADTLLIHAARVETAHEFDMDAWLERGRDYNDDDRF